MPTHSFSPQFSAAQTRENESLSIRRSEHLAVDGISHSYADRRVLSDISFTAAPGDRIGLVGENGAGKSTLLRILGGTLTPDRGNVSHPASFGHLRQELAYADDTPVGRVLDDAQRDALAAQAHIESAGAKFADHPDDDTLAEEYAQALEAAERTDAWAAASRRGATVAGLGLERIAEDTAIGELSGGQRIRLALAAILLEAPHTLLLDEPSNHLDDAAAQYLESVLAAWSGIVIIASHDRTLLDAVTTRILDLDPAPVPAEILADADTAVDPGSHHVVSRGDQHNDSVDSAPSTSDPGTGFGVRSWGMNYSAMRVAQRQERQRWAERYAAELKERADLVHEIEIGSREVNRKHESKSEARITRKYYADKDARVTARRARNARVRLEQLERDRVRRPPEALSFSLPSLIAGATPAATAGTGESEATPQGAKIPTHTAPAASAPLLSAHRVSIPGRLAEISLDVAAESRVLLEGANGAGKSTFLAILAGELTPSHGTIERAPHTRIGYLPQDTVFERPELSALDTYELLVGVDRAQQQPLPASGLLAVRDVSQPVGALSVGQRRRLALAIVLADPPPLLLLDEPSNHLSLTLVEELEAALHDYPGALVIASHDRWLRERWEGETLRITQAATR